MHFENPASEILFQLLRHLATYPDRNGRQPSIVEACVFLDTITANVMDNATPKQITELAEAAKQVRLRLLAMPQK
jgi:hypothetical protein